LNILIVIFSHLIEDANAVARRQWFYLFTYLLTCLLCRQMLYELLPANLVPVLEAEEWKQVGYNLQYYLCSGLFSSVIIKGFTKRRNWNEIKYFFIFYFRRFKHILRVNKRIEVERIKLGACSDNSFKYRFDKWTMRHGYW